MTKKQIVKFNVLEFDWNKRDVQEYNVLPYFINRWKDKKFNFDKKDVKTKEDLKNWIKRVSQYQYWGRCEYECLIAPWPFGSKQMFDELAKIEIKTENYNNICNIIMRDMTKIDVHTQIMMNIDIITDILTKEFKID